MERIDRIWGHAKYQECLRGIEEQERHRPFCRHTPEHFLEAARLTYLLALENHVAVDKELIYAAAFLHDIGRHLQYEKGIPHEEASALLAEEILKDCGFTEEESWKILEAVQGHRTKQEAGDFPGLFYRADKLSRSCFCCPARAECSWPEEKKNLHILY